MGDFKPMPKKYNLPVSRIEFYFGGKCTMKDTTAISLKIIGFMLILACVVLLKNSEDIVALAGM